jgi:hypothetical protein
MTDHLPQIPPLAINARFLEGSMTAVNRVALELSKALVYHARAQGVPNAIQLIGYPALESAMIETGLSWQPVELSGHRDRIMEAIADAHNVDQHLGNRDRRAIRD